MCCPLNWVFDLVEIISSLYSLLYYYTSTVVVDDHVYNLTLTVFYPNNSHEKTTLKRRITPYIIYFPSSKWAKTFSRVYTYILYPIMYKGETAYVQIVLLVHITTEIQREDISLKIYIIYMSVFPYLLNWKIDRQ